MVDMDVKSVIFVITFSLLNAAVCGDKIPVLIWSNNDLPAFPVSLEGHTISKANFYDDYLHLLAGRPRHNLLVFMQDKLSIEDITRHADVYNENSDGAAFYNLKHYMAQASTHLPGVSSPADAITSMRKLYQGQVHILNSPYSVGDLPSLADGGHLVLVSLPDTADSEEARDQTLRKIDGIMGHVASHLDKQNVPYTAMYTARSSSQEKKTELHRSLGRHLLSESDQKVNYTWVNVSNCLLFYARGIILREVDYSNKKKLKAALPEAENPIVQSCQDDIVKLQFTYPSVKGEVNFTNVEIKMMFNHTRSTQWALQEISIKYTSHLVTDRQAIIDYRSSKNIYGPRYFCYHCTETSYMKEANRDPETQTSNIEIKFHGLQVQQKRNGTSRDLDEFSDHVNDCIGFFTIPILAALTVLLVLILILFFGICMIMNINTMDRFDDPKGKTIQVGTVEN